MSIVNTSINRDNTNDPLVPTPVSAQIIQEMVKSSALLSLLPDVNKVPMSSKTNRQPVLSVLPEAYFVNGDTGLKQTSSQDWENLELVAEELAVIIPVPEAYLSDSQVPIWDQVRPRIAEAFGRKLDLAGLFGVNKPGTWGTSIVDGIEASGNVVTEGDNDDLAADIAEVAQKIAEDGFDVSGFVAAPGFSWRLIGLRSQQGVPIYVPNLAQDQPSGLYGRPFPELGNGGWVPAEATVIAGDWDFAVVGIRQDITFRMFTEGVITDDNGVVIVNLMQQDSVAIRAVMRLAFATANPITPVNTNDATRFPFGMLQPVNAS